MTFHSVFEHRDSIGTIISPMDFLQKELERKKKALQGAKGASRYVKAGDLRRKQWEEEEKLKKRPEAPADVSGENSQGENKKQKFSTRSDVARGPSGNETERKGTHKFTHDKEAAVETKLSPNKKKDEVAELSPQEVTEKLRVMGLPVRLFGEVSNQGGDEARRNRLRQALAQLNETLAGLKEKDEFRLEKGHSIRNTFLEKDDAEATRANELLAGGTATKEENRTPKEKTEKDNTLPTDPHKRIYKYFKGLLRDWEEDLSNRSEEAKRSVAGKNETKTMQQCRDYIGSLFKQCKKRQLEEGQLQNIVKIVDYCVEGEFVKAHDAYMDVAIGRAAWPIGVTMVGIHARTGRSKIESQNVAHVMNSELQRKYLTSIKRLMTYAQNKRPDIHPSKKVVN